MMQYVVFDLETTTTESFGRKANPFDKRNFIVAAGWKFWHTDSIATVYSKRGLHSMPQLDAEILVGHNIKFDLLYIWEEPWVQAFIGRGGKIFDTQLAEYLITGQTNKYSSLNQCAKKYGCTLKNDKIKEMWEAGIDTTDIQQDSLIEYLRDDVRNTEIVFLNQIERLKKLGMFNLAVAQMDSILATTEMEYNGMYIDKEIAYRDKEALIIECGVLDNEILSMVKELDTWPVDINLSSPDHLSAIFFSGNVRYVEKEPKLDSEGNPVIYKSGKKKGQIWKVNTAKESLIKGYGAIPNEEWMSKTAGVYSTSVNVLQELSLLDNEAGKFADKMLLRRKLNKELNTYYTGMLNLVHPIDNCLHGSLNHVSTDTGRLSSKKPNMQNITSSEK